MKYSTVPGPAGSGVKITVNGKDLPYTDAKTSNPAIAAAVAAAGYPKTGDAGIGQGNVRRQDDRVLEREVTRGDDRSPVQCRSPPR